MVQPVEQPPLPVAQIVIVQNWLEELKRLAPIPRGEDVASRR
jgi:hypothetical protein